jgi:hypothetical protein
VACPLRISGSLAQPVNSTAATHAALHLLIVLLLIALLLIILPAFI